MRAFPTKQVSSQNQQIQNTLIDSIGRDNFHLADNYEWHRQNESNGQVYQQNQEVSRLNPVLVDGLTQIPHTQHSAPTNPNTSSANSMTQHWQKRNQHQTHESETTLAEHLLKYSGTLTVNNIIPTQHNK